jgi:hypothetical protein
MSTLKATNIQNAASSTTNILLNTDGTITTGTNMTVTGTAVMSSPYTMRNKIINGAMVIDQRNAGASVAITTSDNYITDRFVGIVSANSKLTGQQNAGSVTPPTGFVNYLGMTVAASANVTVGATDFYVVGQQVEGFNIADLAWGTASAVPVTLSFWVRSSLTGTFGGSLRNSGATRSYPFTYTISAANTWEQKSVTITGDTSGTWLTTNGIGIRLLFGLGVGSTYSGTAGSWAGANYISATGATKLIETNSATFYITGVQLERGTIATPFEYRNYQQELAMCQRYYCKTFSIGTAPGNNVTSTGALKGALRSGTTTEPSANWKFPVSMRTEPTVTLYNTGSGTAGQWSADGTATSSANARSQWISTEGCAMDNTGVAFNNLANIQAAASAEL